MKKYIMSLDQGTTSSRCIIFDKSGGIVSMAQREFSQIFPREGWVEHDPMEIWATQISVAVEAMRIASIDAREIGGIGITNQRETTVVWNKRTGKPICNAIVWQCRRTAQMCESMRSRGYDKIIRERTGLLLDPYFSATKLLWILDNVDGAREMAENGELAFGTIDSWLIYKLSGGKCHLTDVSNASRTMLFNIHTRRWDEDIMDILGIPRSVLPTVCPSSCIFAETDPEIFGISLPIGGVAGDQQAALFGQCCFNKGDTKNTYGTGAFLLMNTGDVPYTPSCGLISTVGWSIGSIDNMTYALEGSVFTCGAAIQWLRDGLKIIDSAAESEYYASNVPDSGGVMVVPAFSGLGAPWWDPYARGTIIGITRATTRNHIVRATLESLAFQTADVVALMERAVDVKIDSLRVDGGASANGLLMSIQADTLGVPIERPECVETTALGAAYLAGLAVGMYSSLNEIRSNTANDKRFEPKSNESQRKAAIEKWHKAVSRAMEWAEE